MNYKFKLSLNLVIKSLLVQFSFMLKGSSVLLQTVREADLPELYTHFTSLEQRGPYLPGEVVSEPQFKMEFYEHGFWNEERGILLLHAEDRLCGAIWYEKVEGGLSLFFYMFRKEDRGKGWMKEAIDLFTAYLFSAKKIERIQIAVPDYCKAALHLAQKCGFQFEGIARSALFHRGRYLDLCIYSLLRGECKGIEKIYT